jgi:hypothetical protein
VCTSLRTSLRTSRGAHFTAYFTGCVPHMRTLCVLPCPYTASSLQPPTLIISDMCFLRHVLQRTLTSLSSDMCFINTYITFLRHVLQQTLTSLSCDMCFNKHLHHFPPTCASTLSSDNTFLRQHFPPACASTNTYITFLRHVLQQTLTSLSSGMCFNKHLHHFPPTCASTPSSDNTFLRQHFPPTCASTFTYITFLRHVLQHFPPTTLSSGMCFNKHLHQHQSNPNMYSS